MRSIRSQNLFGCQMICNSRHTTLPLANWLPHSAGLKKATYVTSRHLVLNAPPGIEDKSQTGTQCHRGVLRKVCHANMCLSVALKHTQTPEIDRLKGHIYTVTF